MIRINPTIFRAYDIRGIYPNELNEKAVELIINAYCHLYPSARKIVVARDVRLSSPSLRNTIVKILAEEGREVIDIGIAPDSLFYFSILHYRFDGGVMVSGSHNPKEYNGLMLSVRKPGQDMVEDVIEGELEKIKNIVMEGEEFKASQRLETVKQFNPQEDYINYVCGKIRLKRPLKIIIDSGNGACGYLPEKIFKRINCDAKTLYGEFDGTFPHHWPDPYHEDNLRDVKKAVLEEKADLGFAFDADGDRIALIDARGRTVEGDFCMLMLAKDALQKKKGPIVHDVRVSKAFLDELDKQDVKHYFSVCHHNAVIKNIIKYNAVFGGEITLHFFFPLDYYLCDDGVFSALKLAEVVSGEQNFAEYVDALPRCFASPEVFIDTTDEEKFQQVNDLLNYLRANNYDFIDVDGARINFERGWALVRPSNTSPMIKCRFEGDTKQELIKIEKEMLETFEKNGIPVTKKTYQELGLSN